MAELFKKYKEMILYVLFGGLTTLVNIVTYMLLCDQFGVGNVMSNNIIAWILSVLFAYITNKLFVFDSRSFAPAVLFKEMVSFFSCRLSTGLMDLAIMYVFVDKNVAGLAKYNLIVKICSNVLVIILNYVASKLLIFRKKPAE